MTMIQIRNVPEEVHRALKARAASEGLSLSEYLLREITAVARRPRLEDVLERAKRRGAMKGGPSSARAIRAEREGR